MNDCVFCAAFEKDVPASIVYEDELAVALLDLYPVHAGHTLVIPRMHVENLTACPPDVAAHLFKVCQMLGPAVVEAAGGTAFNVWTANGEDAGQRVFHMHLHILPRFTHDTFGLRFPKGYPVEASRAELDEMADRIRSKVRR